MKIDIRYIEIGLFLFLVVLMGTLSTLVSPYLFSLEFQTDSWQLSVDERFNTTFWWVNYQRLFGFRYADVCFGIVAVLLALYVIDEVERPSRSIWLRIRDALTAVGLFLLMFQVDGPLFLILGQILLSVVVIQSVFAGERLALLYAALLIASCLFFSTQVSPFIIAIVSLMVIWPRQAQRPPITVAMIAFTIFAVIFTYWAVQLQLERPLLPDFGYPGTARVVPDDGLPGNSTPLIGESTVIPFTDRAALKENYQLTTILTCLVTLLLSCLSSLRYWRLSLFLIVCLCADVVLPESVSSISPIETVRRMVPGLFPLQLTSLFLALTFSSLWLGMKAGIARVAVMTLCIVPNLIGPMRGVSQTNMRNASPSLNLVRAEGASTIELLNSAKGYRKVSAFDLQGVVTVSHQTKKKVRKLLSDGKSETRWSPLRGAQYGDEWIQIEFPEATTMYGIELQPGRYFSDFPRGLSIEGCNTKDTQRRFLIKKISDWQGGLALSPLGFPYYSGQHDVTVLFPGAVSTACLRISQTAEDLNYDWSVAELRILTGK